MPPKREQTPQEIAEILGVNELTIRRSWIKAGCPHSRRKGKIFLNDGETQAWLKENDRSTKPGRPPEAKDPLPEGMEGDKDYWLARKYRSQCLKEEGRLVDKDEYRLHWMQEVAIIKNKCRGMGAALAPSLVGVDAAEIQTKIDQRVEQIFRELSE